MIVSQSWWQRLRNYRKYSAEEDFYWKLTSNHYYPFEDLGNGFYYIRYRPTAFYQGFIILGVVCFFTILYLSLVGAYPLPTFMCILGILFGLNFLYGNLCNRELIISRLGGYLIRVQANKKVLAEQEIYNIYIRLHRGIDSLFEFHYYLVLGGYLLDDIKISRYGSNEKIMRQLGKRLARNLGINYFDYDDLTSKHNVYHYKGYSRLQWKRTDLAQLFAAPWSIDAEEEIELQDNKFQRRRTLLQAMHSKKQPVEKPVP